MCYVFIRTAEFLGSVGVCWCRWWCGGRRVASILATSPSKSTGRLALIGVSGASALFFDVPHLDSPSSQSALSQQWSVAQGDRRPAARMVSQLRVSAILIIIVIIIILRWMRNEQGAIASRCCAWSGAAQVEDGGAEAPVRMTPPLCPPLVTFKSKAFIN